MNKLQIVGKDIIGSENKKIIKQIKKEFFEFCRKHNIKYGTPNYVNGEVVGITCANYDWTMTLEFFLSTLCNQVQFDIMLDEVPEDLRY